MHLRKERQQDKAGSVIWITGASSGIGAALAYYYAACGARLIISARSIAGLISVREKCETLGAKAYIHPLDLEELDTLNQKVTESLAVFGEIDMIIHAGGVSQRALAQEITMDVGQRIINTNFWGAVVITRSLLSHMLAKKSGRIVVVSSLTGKFGTRYRSLYAASKHALHGYFDSLRCEIEDQGIGVTLICPGYIQTDISRHALLANGSFYGTMDAGQLKGMPASICARKIGEAIRQGKREVYIGGKEVYAVRMKGLWPGLFFRLIKKAKIN